MAHILVIGELLAEFMAERIGQTFREPGTFLGPYPSGAPAIFADQAAKTGANAVLVGCLGEDGFGDLILDRLRNDGVDVTSISRTKALPTGTAFVTYREDGSREFIYNIGNSAAALVDANAIDQAVIQNCGYLHVMGSSLGNERSIAAVKNVLSLVKECGGKVTFDPNIRPEMLSSPVLKEALDFILAKSDILLPSEADLRHFCGPVAESEAVSTLLGAHPLECIVVKNAAKGSVYYDRTRSLHVPAFVVDEVDPTGAGDCYGGTLVSCLAQNFELEKALTLANAAGALAVTQRGPMEGNSTLTQLKRFAETSPRRT